MSWTCGATACDTHNSPTDRCNHHKWLCRAVDCLGRHLRAEEDCGLTHLQWICGSDEYLGQHLTPDLSTDRCRNGRWRCGSLVCPTHPSPDLPHRCAHGAALVPAPMHLHVRVGRRVMDILGNRHTRRLSFSLFGSNYRLGDFESIRRKIQAWDIFLTRRQVEVRESGRTVQTYLETLNIMVVTNEVFPTYEEEGGVIHECIHAIQDSRGVEMRRAQSEAAAYVGQMLYMIYASPGGPDAEINNIASLRETDVAEKLQKVASVVAANIYLRSSPDLALLQELLNAVVNVPMYSRQEETVHYDGVSRWY